MWKWLGALLIVMLAVISLAARLLTSGAMRTPAAAPAAPAALAAPAAPIAAGCQTPQAFAQAARTNARSRDALEFEPFGRKEIGWEIYAPAIAAWLGTDCAPDTPGFAAALARWQEQKPRGLAPTGVLDGASFEAMRVEWMLRRPFVRATAAGACPAAPPPTSLAPARPDEGFSGKQVELRPGALAAYRRMVPAARREIPGLPQDRLAIFSGFRSPEADAGRCQAEQNCGGPERATCSAHRTGLAMDLYLGAAPGFAPESSEDENRLFQSRTPAYRWLVRNAGRFGFIGYPFEPWHWEWTGEPVSS
jgi:hypothetical protein